MQKWLITGSTGFLGSNAGRLISKSHQTIGVSRYQEARFFDRQYCIDITKPSEVESLLREVKPDVVLHCAALASHEECELNPDLARTVNVQSSATLAGMCSEIGSTLIHISTDAVFDGSRGNYSELDEVNPFSVYGETKAQAEVEVARLNPDALIVRTNFFGWSPSGRSSVLEFFVRGLSQTGDVIGYTDYRVTSIYVDDLVAIICDSVKEKWDGLLHVASSDVQSKFEFGRLVAAELNLPPSRVVPGKRWAPKSLDLGLDTSHLRNLTSERIPTQQSGIHRALEATSSFIGS